jgi:hypothetical protein
MAIFVSDANALNKGWESLAAARREAGRWAALQIVNRI